MKSGLTIVEMAQQIERQSKLKQDYLLDTRRLQVEPFGSQLYLHTFDDHDDPLVEPLEINQIAHRQIGTHLKIPAAYYDRMLSDYPELLAENVNSWFQREPTQRIRNTLTSTFSKRLEVKPNEERKETDRFEWFSAASTVCWTGCDSARRRKHLPHFACGGDSGGVGGLRPF